MPSQTATILVTDLVGSTELRARIGDEHAERLRRLHDRLSRTAIETHGGLVVKGLGDGVLASFSEASAALAAAVAVQQAAEAHTERHPDLPLVLRVGLSAGDVTVDGGDVFGTPVVEASRLCAAAAGGQILSGEVVRLLVKGRGSYSFTSIGSFDLKGLPEPVTASEVAWTVADDNLAVPFPKLLDLDGGFEFTGRLGELERLRRAWDEAAGGETTGVLIGGEPGVGKTRLAAEVARVAYAAGATVLYGRCDEGLAVPYEPFVEALAFFCDHTVPADLRSRLGRYPGELARLLPDLSDLIPGLDPPLRSEPETEQYRLFQAVASWLAAAAEASGLMLVVDDLQWAAPPTLRLAEHVLASTTSARLLVVGTFRDTEVTSGEPVATFLADARRISRVERLALEGLTVDELTKLLGPDGGATVAATLHEETKGNPFFVGELLRESAEADVALDGLTIPEGVRDVIVARVARLAAPTGELLAVAAVLGGDVELSPLATVAGVDTDAAIDALDEAVAARLVEETGLGRYRFVHALVRTALDTTLSATRRGRLHLRAAEVFAADPLRRAYHLLACAPLGGGLATAGAALAAGERALALLADADAARWFCEGLALVPDDEEMLRIDLLTGLGEAQRRIGAAESRGTLLTAARLAAGAGDATRLVRALIANSRGFSSTIGGVDEDRLELIEAALDLVGPAATAERAELLSLQANELVFTGDHERVLAAADEAASIADGVGDVVVQARVGVRWLFACQVPHRSVAVAEKATALIGVADATADPQLRMLARRPTPLLVVGQLSEAHRRTTDALAIAEESGQPGLRSRSMFDYAGTLDALGEHEEAERLTQLAFELGQQAGWTDAMQFYGGRMLLHWSFEGQADVVVAMAGQAVANSPRLVAWRAAVLLGLALSGRYDELAGTLAGVPELLDLIPFDHFWLSAHALLAVALGFGVDDRIAAARLYERLLPHRSLHASYGIGYWGPVEMGLAVAARLLGECDGALAHHEAAAATIEGCGAARARAINGDQWARSLLARDAPGDRQRAVDLAEETLAYSKSKGYTTFVTKTEELLAGIT